MDRRKFMIASSVFAASSFTSTTFAGDGPCIPEFKRTQANVDTQSGGGGHSGWQNNVDGWQYKLNEDDHVLFSIIMSNAGPKAVQLAHCQQFTGAFVVTNTYRVEPSQKNITVLRDWRATNDWNFYFMEVEQPNGGFLPVFGGTVGDSNAILNGPRTIGTMGWLKPQKVDIQLIAHDTRH